jgi:quinol monooxygenase YgiN
VAEVIIAGWMDYAGHRDEVLSHLREVTRVSRAEPGCLAYAMTADTLYPDRIQVFERWSSPEALAEHLTARHVLDFRAAIAGITRTGRGLDRFTVLDVQEMVR